MMILGMALFAVSAGLLARNYRHALRRRSFPFYGFLGLAAMAAATVLLALKIWIVTIYFTPIMWTGYILAVDAAVLAVRGRSMLVNSGAAFAAMASLSVPLWLVFEAYNVRLQNWSYIGLPENWLPRNLGYAWAFATIWPAILETTEFLLATQFFGGSRRPILLPHRLLVAVGATLMVLPVALPRVLGCYLFGLVWIAFAFLLDPLNYYARRASIVADLRGGDRTRLWALMGAGLICGFFWECWNYPAGAKWIYIFPLFQQAKIFEMPLIGYLGFPAFAVEVFAMYVFATRWLPVPYYEVR